MTRPTKSRHRAARHGSREAEFEAATGAQFVSDDVDPLVDLIRAQRLAVELARYTSRDPDRPQALSFSVVLDDDRR